MKYLPDFIALALLYGVVFFKKWRQQGMDRLFINTLMYVYLSFVLYFTLMPVVVSLPFLFNHPYVPMSLTPFEDYLLGRGDTVRQIALNVLMTVPFGFLLPLVKKRGLLSCALWTLGLSLCIELLQPLVNGTRSSDVTDLITNTAGGVLGCLLYLLFRFPAEAVLRRLRSGAKT